ncbi:nucleoporin Nup120/160 [Candidatus Marsarchaeota archaeon]|nr:nucleoporin Nup120/160 [Candidatus Marsarchaeota archaeon]
MLFDIFNSRNVPNIFAYAALLYGLALTVLYLNASEIAISAVIAAIVLGLGYAVYRAGQLGAADVIEFATISLILPFQKTGLIYSFPQGYLPSVISLAINSGIAALIIVPLYYIPKSGKRFKHAKAVQPHFADYFKTILILVVYLFFLLFLIAVVHSSAFGIALLIVIAIGSGMVLLYEKRIMAYMVQYVNYRMMEPGDMIAVQMIDETKLKSLKRRIKGFGRLVTPELLKELAKKYSGKLPVYKKGIPFAVPIFVGALALVLYGNVLFTLIPRLPI